MAFNKDIKMKTPMVKDYGTNLQEAFRKGKMETSAHYKAVLFMYKELHEATVRKHLEEGEVARVQGKLELCHDFFTDDALPKENERLQYELRLAEAKLADVKVPSIDWFKLNEP